MVEAEAVAVEVGEVLVAEKGVSTEEAHAEVNSYAGKRFISVIHG
jgi:hypothetical protein